MTTSSYATTDLGVSFVGAAAAAGGGGGGGGTGVGSEDAGDWAAACGADWVGAVAPSEARSSRRDVAASSLYTRQFCLTTYTNEGNMRDAHLLMIVASE